MTKRIEPPAVVEVNSDRQYVNVNDSACELLGYTRDELLRMRIDDISFPSGAHVDAMFQYFRDEGKMRGIFAVKTKNGQALRIRYESAMKDGRMIAHWTEYEPLPETE